MKANLFLILLLTGFSGCSYSEDRSIPIAILAKPMNVLKSDSSRKFEKIKFPVSEDSSEKKDAYKVTDSKGHFVVIIDDNGDDIGDALIVSDSYYETDKKIKVGDNLKKVMAAYSDAKFYGDFNMPELIKVTANNGKLRFSFDTTGLKLEDIIKQGGFSVNSEDIASAPVWKIYIEK